MQLIMIFPLFKCKNSCIFQTLLYEENLYKTIKRKFVKLPFCKFLRGGNTAGLFWRANGRSILVKKWEFWIFAPLKFILTFVYNASWKLQFRCASSKHLSVNEIWTVIWSSKHPWNWKFKLIPEYFKRPKHYLKSHNCTMISKTISQASLKIFGLRGYDAIILNLNVMIYPWPLGCN